MPIIELQCEIQAPVARVFDLSRSIDLHIVSTDQTGEQAIAGRTNGLIEDGEEVTWRARHFGIWQQLTSRITAYDRPHHFRDSMVRGAFKRFDHDHYFTENHNGTHVRDIFSFDAHLGALGVLASHLVLKSYMRRFLIRRNLTIKRVAESSEWQSNLSDV